jgi:hypothetical protein
MLSSISVEGITYHATDEPLQLLGILRRHLDPTLPNAVTLRPDEVLSLKSWLIDHAERMTPGKAIWIEESNDGLTYRVVAAIGKTEAGNTIVWHQPLPWPFGFHNESKLL